MVAPGMVDDFGEEGPKKSASMPQAAEGKKRPWLKVFETMPPQMLNAYGPAKFAKMTDSDVWQHLSTPLKSGAQYMSEDAKERKGIGINRRLHALMVRHHVGSAGIVAGEEGQADDLA